MEPSTGTFRLKTGLAEMLKGGVIMDVTTAEEARIAEEAGAVAVMSLERVPADIRAQGGVARMANPKKVKEIMATVSIPVMAKCRIGHFVEAQILQSLGESNVPVEAVRLWRDRVVQLQPEKNCLVFHGTHAEYGCLSTGGFQPRFGQWLGQTQQLIHGEITDRHEQRYRNQCEHPPRQRPR